MGQLFRTIIGLGFGWMLAGFAALLGRFHQAPAGRKTQRRSFVRNAALGAVGAASLTTAAGFGMLLWPNKTGAFGSELTVNPGDIPPVDGTPFRNIQGRFFLVHNQDGLMALYTKCPHLGCTVPWLGPPESDQAFQCPCHGSMYNYNGVLTAGPAPRPMDYMRVTVEGGAVMVDTGEIMQRAAYEPGQAVPYTA
ncbi:MAG: Rieske 2Fe-2S domain-containing protein [Chloroflexota bacterium]|nr:Rieske 2Fe-2S domain-containing protein [Chloroflexota bacterium]